jgi:tRNA-splicing ligase RtcB
MITDKNIFKKITDYSWEIPVDFQPGMRVPGIIYADEKMLAQIITDNAYKQVANVATLPGIVRAAYAMPDIHWGYGFPIGGVAAFDPDEGGVISPGGVGYDINCGIRMVRTNLEFEAIKDKIEDIVYRLAAEIPSGVGSKGEVLLNTKQLDKILEAGSKIVIQMGFGLENDLEKTEEKGCLEGANPDKVSQHAKERGNPQAGTLGSGNHFTEIQVVEEIFNEPAAATLGLFKGQITAMIHSGSRGLGHQVCTDYLSVMQKAHQKYHIQLPDRQLACAPINSEEGRDYFAAMAAAANFAWANRQVLMHLFRQAFVKVFGRNETKLGLELVYDVAHNIAKKEKYTLAGQEKILCIHRKGATRAFEGQPVLVPGDMGRYSFVMTGTKEAEEKTFGSVCHGAGRAMSRSEATRKFSKHQLLEDLKQKGVFVQTATVAGLVEEAPQAYKDVTNVVEVVHQAGLAKKVARMRPVGVIKG